MAKFESNVKQIPYSQATVYNSISDLNHLERLRDRIPEDKVQNLAFDRDSVSVEAPMVGRISMQIVERQEPKCVKFGSIQSPMPFNVWVQVLSVDELSSKMKVTIDADIPLIMRGMVSGPLQDAVEKMADALSQIPYDAL